MMTASTESSYFFYLDMAYLEKTTVAHGTSYCQIGHNDMVFNIWMDLFQQIKSLTTKLSVYGSRYLCQKTIMKAWLIVFWELSLYDY